MLPLTVSPGEFDPVKSAVVPSPKSSFRLVMLANGGATAGGLARYEKVTVSPTRGVVVDGVNVVFVPPASCAATGDGRPISADDIRHSTNASAMSGRTMKRRHEAEEPLGLEVMRHLPLSRF